MKISKIFSWILQIVVAILLGQTLFFKFSGAQESIDLFTKVGMEPYGRIITGIFELIAVILILIPQSVPFGAILSWGVMSGAILAHIFKLGFSGDAGLLGAMAIVAWVASAIIIYIRRDQIPIIRAMFANSGNSKST